MKPEEFEVYVIPPNFMEGGTLFGGLLKTRNTVEAVILGLAVGVPVLHLPFSLTVRVVILCLTALPLVLLALIGVSGMSLSAFIRLFFCFLHNRRILSRDGTQGGKNGKTLLPSWAQQRKSDCEAEDPPLPKSRSRFSVDLKQRSVTQFKTFLQEEEAVQPLNALADYIPIEKIEHGVIYTRDHRYLLLTLTALCGEYPIRQISRLPGGSAYLESVVTALRRDGLLRTFSKDGLRGLRLTTSAKRLLLADAPEWFSAYLTGSSEPNKLKSEIPRRLRLHRMAEILTIMHNTDIPAFPWEKAPFPAVGQSSAIPAYYTSREVKEIGPQGTKIRSSRATGILLTDGGIFLTYNTAKAQMKWEYKAELRLKALLQTEEVMPDAEISGIVFGSSMEQLSISAASEPMPPADGAELEQWFGGQDGVASILNALKMFEQD